MEKKQNKRNKLPLVLALLLLMSLVIYGTNAYFSDSKLDKKSELKLTLGSVSIDMQAEPWELIENTTFSNFERTTVVSGDITEYVNLMPGDSIEKSIVVKNNSSLPTNLTLELESDNLPITDKTEIFLFDAAVKKSDGTPLSFEYIPSNRESNGNKNSATVLLPPTNKNDKLTIHLSIKVKEDLNKNQSEYSELGIDLSDLKINVAAEQRNTNGTTETSRVAINVID